MGEIADDIIDGSCCALCGQYFTNDGGKTLYDHGYPVACKECWTPDCGYEEADEEVETL
jgi:hypothetical protein